MRARRAAVLFVAATIAALAACGVGPGAPPDVASPSPPPEIPRFPNAIAVLECDGAPSDMGGRADDFGAEGAGDTPGAAFANWVGSTIFPVPRSGYAELFEDERGGVYAYAVDGKVKVVVVISRRFAEMTGAPYTLEELRTCDPVEYGPAVDLGPGHTVWAHADGRIITDIVGPRHCDWQSMRILHLTENERLIAQYIRDPEGVLPGEALLATYADEVAVPAEASPSGYKHGDLELWFSESDTALYVVGPAGRAERWPKAATTIACA